MNYNEINDYMMTGVDPYPEMTTGERIKCALWQIAGCVLAIIAGLIFCAALGSCTTTKYVPVIEHHTDTLWQNRVQIDSVYLKDSTHVSEKGDAVRIDHFLTKFIKKEVHDTIYISKTDSVPAPYPVDVKVPAELSWWQSFRMTLGSIMLIAMVIAVGVWIINKKLHIH